MESRSKQATLALARLRARNHDPTMSNGRALLAVILGLALNMLLGFASIALAWTIFGAEGAFRGETTVASFGWSAFGCGAGLVVGGIAGCVTSVVARQAPRLPVFVLAGLLLVIGLGSAVLQLGVEPRPLPAGKSVGELTFFEAGEVATSPTWYSFAAPGIVALGVLIGGRVLCARRS